MPRIRRPAYNTNTTNFQFEGYINKFITVKPLEEGEEERIIGIYVSFGPNKYGKSRFTINNKYFEGDLSLLKEGEPYRFTVNVTTNSFSADLEWRFLINVEPLNREPIKDYRNFVGARIKEIITTVSRELDYDVVVLEVDSDNSLGYDTYYCRYRSESADSRPTTGFWNVELAFKTSPDHYEFDERVSAYYILQDGEFKWIPLKDKDGNVVVETLPDGSTKPKMERRFIKSFTDTIRILSLSKPE